MEKNVKKSQEIWWEKDARGKTNYVECEWKAIYEVDEARRCVKIEKTNSHILSHSFIRVPLYVHYTYNTSTENSEEIHRVIELVW